RRPTPIIASFPAPALLREPQPERSAAVRIPAPERAARGCRAECGEKPHQAAHRRAEASHAAVHTRCLVGIARRPCRLPEHARGTEPAPRDYAVDGTALRP